MPRLISFRLAAACALALSLLLPGAAAAAQKGVPASIRVVASDGRILADKELRARTTAVPTSRRADCFGPDKAGSGRAVRVTGPTPLGMLVQAARGTRSLRPVLVTDAFSFGLGLCGIGGLKPSGEGFWQLRVNHEAPEAGGDAIRVRRGDEVLWYLSSGFPAPDELWLRAPRRARPGRAVRVRVLAFDERGRRSPARGATVAGGGARARTGADGTATLTLRRPARLVARLAGHIPSNREAVCVGGKCPRG